MGFLEIKVGWLRKLRFSPSADENKSADPIYDVSGKIIAHYNLYGSLDEYTLPKVEKKGLYLFSVNMIDGKEIAGKFFSYAK